MNIQQVIKYYGGETKAAAELGKSHQCILNWKKQKTLSKWNQAAIQAYTGGKLKADLR
jgi:hypothetical protein